MGNEILLKRMWSLPELQTGVGQAKCVCVCAGGGNTLRDPSSYRLAAGNRDAGISLDLLPGKCQVGDEKRTEGVEESH